MESWGIVEIRTVENSVIVLIPQILAFLKHRAGKGGGGVVDN